MSNRLLRAEEVAEFLGVRRQRVYELVAEGRLPAYRLGERALRFAPSAIDAFLERAATCSEEQPEQAA